MLRQHIGFLYLGYFMKKNDQKNARDYFHIEMTRLNRKNVHLEDIFPGTPLIAIGNYK